MKRQQLWERLEETAVRLREASIAAAQASGEAELVRTHAEWVAADAAFREVVDKLRALRAREKKRAAK